MKYVVLFLASLLTLGLAQPAPMSAELTLLFESIEEGNAGGLASALEFGADVNGRNQDGLTPLMIAVGFDRSEFVETLIAAGADVNAVGGPDGYTALHFAAEDKASERIVTALIRAGADVNRMTPIETSESGEDYGGVTPLMIAAGEERLDTVDALIAAGADVNAASATGWTALHSATRNFDPERIVASLLQAGANPNRATASGVFPIAFARMTRNTAVEELLLAASADLTMLFESIEEDDAATFTSALANVADVNGWNQGHQDELTPLMFAVSLDRAEFVDALIEAGADVNVASISYQLRGMTALHFAAEYGASERVVASLIRAGADVNRMTPLTKVESGTTLIVFGGDTPLMIAAREAHLATVDALIAAGADVNAADDDGWTALHAAAGNPSGGPIVASLLQAGADPNRADQNGTLPVDRARSLGNTAVAEQLRTVISPETLATRRLEDVRALYDGYAGLVAEARTYPVGCVALLRSLPASVRAYGDFAYAEGGEFVFVGYGRGTIESTNPILMMELDSKAMRESMVQDLGLRPVETVGVFQTTMGPIPQYSVFAGSEDLSWLTVLVANDIASAGEARVCLGVALGPRP